MISICIKENNIKLQDYLINEINKSGIDNILFSKHSFKQYDNLIVHYKGEDIDVFYDFLSKIIANAFIKFYEPIKVNRLIHFDYFYFDKNDKKIIFDEYKILIDKISNYEKELKFRKISVPLRDYLKNNKSIILEGFLNFRLRDYIEYLKELLQEAVNQFLIDKEYIEFVNLLKGYVDSKVPNNELVNLVYVNNEAILLSQDGNIIALDEFDLKYLSDISFSNNDYVLNTLVGILPSQIVLHLATPKDNFIKTIELIFGNKVKTCSGCDLCSAYKILNLK